MTRINVFLWINRQFNKFLKIRLRMIRLLLAGLALELLNHILWNSLGVNLLAFTMATWRFKSLKIQNKVHFAFSSMYLQSSHFYTRTHPTSTCGNNWTTLSVLSTSKTYRLIFKEMSIGVIGQESNDVIIYYIYQDS